jgi:hypothetical protein
MRHNKHDKAQHGMAQHGTPSAQVGDCAFG